MNSSILKDTILYKIKTHKFRSCIFKCILNADHPFLHYFFFFILREALFDVTVELHALQHKASAGRRIFYAGVSHLFVQESFLKRCLFWGRKKVLGAWLPY